MSMDFSDGHIYVEFNGTDNAAEDMKLQTQNIAKILDQLEEHLKPFIDSWEGDDQQVYVEKQAKWNRAVDNMRQLLLSHSDLLERIGDDYRTNQRNLTTSWESVKIGR
ncbi:WXG100 family type VII secretion target [Streptomyces sp. NPDC059679]|uniref:WXG100 family type VII secretion target n=1 Tax=Streptomyces sp. NPDC059679 TaxID=3346903 RepID=UPI0036A51D2B